MNFDPMAHLSTHPHVTRGPMVIDHRGSILSGHDRHAELTQAYQNPEHAAAYKNALINHSPKFGLDPMKVMRMKHPVLVRKIANADLPHE